MLVFNLENDLQNYYEFIAKSIIIGNVKFCIRLPICD